MWEVHGASGVYWALQMVGTDPRKLWAPAPWNSGLFTTENSGPRPENSGTFTKNSHENSVPQHKKYPLGWSLTIFRGRGPLFFGVGPPIISGVEPHYFLGGTIFSGAGTLVYIFYFGGHKLFTISWGRGPPFFLAKVPTIFMGYGQGFTHFLRYCTLVIFTVNYARKLQLFTSA